jgi:cytochrome c oxidase assembly factor CtaG
MAEFYRQYCLFALVVSLGTFFIYYLPALYKARAREIKNTFTTHIVLSSVVFIVVTFFLAPIVSFVQVVGLFSKVDTFQLGLESEMFKSDD